MTTTPTIQNTLAELNELSAFFIQAEATIKGGGSVDMTDMDARIADVCQAVEAALPEQQEQYLPELTTLLNLLNSCELAIQSMQSNEGSDANG